MDKKNNTFLIVIIVILSLSVGGLSGFIINDKMSNNNDNNITNDNIPNNNDNNNNNEKEEKLPEWAQYLLKQNINEITVYNYGDPYYDADIHACVPGPKKINKTQLEDILGVMTKGKLLNYIRPVGFGGFCVPKIIIIFNNNEELEFYNFKFIITQNRQIINLLKNEDYTDDYSMTGDGTDENLFAYKWDSSYINDLFN